MLDQSMIESYYFSSFDIVGRLESLEIRRLHEDSKSPTTGSPYASYRIVGVREN